ncbi:MAG: beta-glucosidase-like glycosyl hydrolase [Friedmanniella sp.]|nr:beta-glucosidase-like glycosyl hydrolase [Friedmanniella sp.]
MTSDLSARPDPTVEPAGPDWRDAGLDPDARLAALMAELTLREKVAQLTSVWPGVAEVTGNVAPMQEILGQPADYVESVRWGIGHLTRVFGTAPVTVAEGVARLRQLQQTVLEGSRLRIPALVHEECLTGFTAYQATVYPTALAWGATFDPDLVQEMAAAIGADMAAVGVHQGLSPVLDVVRDYRWGRVEETLGEDPYLVARLGAGYVRGLQSQGVIATLKHFAGYSAARAGRNHAPVSIGPRELADVILVPFEYAVREAGVRSVMNSYSDLDGVPAAASHWLLTELLREQWGFTGTVVSDYWSIAFLESMHRVAGDPGAAAALALAAGLDVELPTTLGYAEPLVAEVESGRVPESLVDRALERLLRQKLELGLLDAGWTVTADDTVDLDSAANRDLARRLAEAGVVLLDNPEGLLPLSAETRRVAVIGPCADDVRSLFGCYAFPNHVIPQYPGFDLGIRADSVLTALRAELPQAEVTHAAGCAVSGGDRSGLPAAVELARRSDVVVLAVGDLAGLFGLGTSGEGCDAEDLALPGHQAALVEAVLETGVPVVLVALSGRPYALGAYTGRAQAIVQAFFPGEEGGGAVAGVLSGRVNPSGRLPVQVPAHPGGQPHTYLAPPLGQNSHGVSNLDPTPAYAFGHGLSYTSFGYTDLTVSDAQIDTGGLVEVAVTVTNTGDRDGTDVVQLYLQDPVASVTRPVTQLVGFARVPLAAGASARVTFSVHADRTAFTGVDLRRIVEPGHLTFTVGHAGGSPLPPVGVELVGALRTVGPDRVLDTPVRVDPRP